MESEKWQVDIKGHIYTIDQGEVFQWIRQRKIARTDKVRKGTLPWVEAHTVPIFSPAFQSASKSSGLPALPLAIFGVVCALTLGGFMYYISQPHVVVVAPSPPEKKIKHVPATSIATLWLEKQKRNEPGTLCWCAGTKPEELYAVRSYEITYDGGDNDDTTICKARVESSTKGGIPIVKDWTIHMKKIQDAEGNTSFCIDWINGS